MEICTLASRQPWTQWPLSALTEGEETKIIQAPVPGLCRSKVILFPGYYFTENNNKNISCVYNFIIKCDQNSSQGLAVHTAILWVVFEALVSNWGFDFRSVWGSALQQ